MSTDVRTLHEVIDRRIARALPVRPLGRTVGRVQSVIPSLRVCQVTIDAGSSPVSVAYPSLPGGAPLVGDVVAVERARDGWLMVSHVLGRDAAVELDGVKAYQAVGDDSTNDATAIQAAITATSAAGGGVVVFPDSGIYRISTALVVPAGITLDLQGSTIKGDGAAILIVVTGDGVRILNGTLDGNRQAGDALNDSSFLVYATTFDDLEVSGCTLRNTNGHGVYLTTGVRPKIKHNQFDNNGLMNIYMIPAPQTPTDAGISTNIFSAIGAHTMSLGNTGASKVVDNTILGHVTTGLTVDVSGTAVTATAGSFAALLPGNFLIFNGGTERQIASITDATHLTLSASGGSLSGVPAVGGPGDHIGINGSDNDVSGNLIRYGGSLGVSMSSSASERCQGNKVTGNRIIGLAGSAVSLQPTEALQGIFNTTILDNTIVDCGAGATAMDINTRAGICLIGSGAFKTFIDGNSIVDNSGVMTYWLALVGVAAGEVSIGRNLMTGQAHAGISGTGYVPADGGGAPTGTAGGDLSGTYPDPSVVDDSHAHTSATLTYDAELAAIAGLTSAADKVPYFTGSGTAALADLTTAGRALIDDANASAQRTTLGLGTAALSATGDFDAAGAAAAAQAASQPLDSDLTAIAALTTTAYGRSVLALADAAALRTLAASVIGTDVEAHDADLTTIAGLTPSNDDVLQRKAGAWANRTIAQLLTDLGLGALYQPLDSDLTAIAALSTTSFGRSLLAAADAAALRTLAATVIGTNVQAWDADLDAIAALVSAADKLPYSTGAQAWALTSFTAAGRAIVDDADATAQRATLGLGSLATASSLPEADIYGLTAGFNVTGGGTVAFDATAHIKASARFVVISHGTGTVSGVTAINGYFTVGPIPTSGTVTGAGGHANVTAVAAGVPMTAWDALYYILPLGSGSADVPANWRITTFNSSDYAVPSNWLLVALYNGDASCVVVCNGMVLGLGESQDFGVRFSTSVPVALGAAAVGTAQAPSHGDHVHPTTGLSLTGHGAADHADITRKVFLPAAEAKLDSATAANVGASPDLTGVVAYADAATQGALWTFMVPADWTSGVITLQPVWSPGSTDASAHTVRWSIVAQTVAAGVTVTAAGTTVTFTGASAARTAGVVVYDTATSTTLTPAAAGDLFRFTLRRIGADGADTYVGVVNLLGVIVSYTANQ